MYLVVSIKCINTTSEQAQCDKKTGKILSRPSYDTKISQTMILLVLCGTHFVEWVWCHGWLCQRCFGLSRCRFLRHCVEWRWCAGCRWRTISGVYLPPRAYVPCATSLLALADRLRYNLDWPAGQELLCTPDEAQTTLEELSQKQWDSHYSKPPCNTCID